MHTAAKWTALQTRIAIAILSLKRAGAVKKRYISDYCRPD